MENGKRPYVPMALTLFPTKICLKFASVPVPEAHKYVIPPISYFARSPFRSTPSLSRRHPPLPLRRRLTVTLAQPLTCFCGVVVARGNIRGNTVNHLSRKKTQCNIPAETPLRMSLLLSSPLLSFLLLFPDSFSSRIVLAISHEILLSFAFSRRGREGGSREP